MNMMIMARELGTYPSSTSLYHHHHRRHIPLTPPNNNCFLSLPPHSSLLLPLRLTSLSLIPQAIQGAGGGGDDDGNNGGGRGGGDDDDDKDGSGSGDKKKSSLFTGWLTEGWRSRVEADPEFPFKVLMEELVGVTAFVAGDMATRPNFGLNELDFVFSTMVVGIILNFVLMYVLAPTTATAAASGSSGLMGAMFSNSPQGHMFESGPYGLLDRLGNLIYKGILFGVVGFGAGLSGTAITNTLIAARMRMDPMFEASTNKPPPMLLNSLTWAAHLGFSCNFRYQCLAGIEFLLAKPLPPLLFKAFVIALRTLNNVLGGVSFVTLARLTGSQKQKQKEQHTQPLPGK